MLFYIYMSDTVNDIKSRLGIYDLVSQYVTLKKAGRNFKGLCPFHSEKTPSFVVSPEKEICHCFGCNKGGDIFGFIMELEGIAFPEAVQVLADRAGVKIENVSKLYKGEKKSEKDEYFKAQELAAAFFEKQLHGTNEGKKVLEYLKKRGVTEETIENFKLGFAPHGFEELTPYLLKKGVDRKVLLKSGLSSSKTSTAEEIFDKFRGRLMFPIFDYFGRICGFGGRSLSAEQMPKYLNSPENPIYEKSKVLYGLSHGKKAVKELDNVVLVEGYFDVILPHQEGIQNVVATSGTALTSEQVRLIKRITSNAVLCFDMDNAGFEAAKRAYFLLSEADFSVKAIGDLGVKDPADFVLEKRDAFKDVVQKAPDFVSFYIDKLLKEKDPNNFDDRSKVIHELLPVYKSLSSTARDFYVRELAVKMGIGEQFLYDEIEHFALPESHPARVAKDAEYEDGGKISTEEVLFSIVLEHPGLFSEIVDKVENKDFPESLKNIYSVLSEQYNSARTNSGGWSFEKGFSAEERQKIDILMLYAQESYGEFSEENIKIELNKLIDRMRKVRKMKKLDEVRKQIEEAEKTSDKEKLKELLNIHMQLLES